MTRTGQLAELLDGGDHACANAHHGGLACVCRELAGLLEPPQAARAERIARIALDDLAEATGLWLDLVTELRLPARRVERMGAARPS
jgi:hypothetical protein